MAKTTNRPSTSQLEQLMTEILSGAEQNTVEFHAYDQWQDMKQYLDRLESRCYRASRILMESDN